MSTHRFGIRTANLFSFVIHVLRLPSILPSFRNPIRGSIISLARFTLLFQPELNHSSSSTSFFSRCMLSIIVSNPIVTMISNTNPNHPRTIAAVPTPDLTLPFPRSCAISAAATEAVCCHSTETSTKIELMKIRARATWETGREGKGLTSFSAPISGSSCQPGNVARRMKVMKARTIATMLEFISIRG